MNSRELISALIAMREQSEHPDSEVFVNTMDGLCKITDVIVWRGRVQIEAV